VLAITGPTAWFAAHVIDWIVTPGAATGGRENVLRIVQVAALVVAGVATLLSIRLLRRTRREDDTLARGQRTRWLATSAVALSALSLLLIASNLFVTFALVPGQEP
jgi:hypothetical protein